MKRTSLTLSILLLFAVGCSDSKEDGPFETYWDNGEIREKGTFKNEKLEGLYEFFFRSGQLYQRGNYN